jgi:DNA-binding transcriptional MerR regulator
MLPQERATVAEDFSAKDAAAFSGLTAAMVNYLCRHGMVRPTNGRRRGRGVQRKFSFGDIVVLKAMAKLLDAGVSVSRLKRALVSLRQSHSKITPEGAPGSYLVTDGKDVLLRHKSGVLELLSSGQFSFAFVVELEAVRRDAVAFASGPLAGDGRLSSTRSSGPRRRVA